MASLTVLAFDHALGSASRPPAASPITRQRCPASRPGPWQARREAASAPAGRAPRAPPVGQPAECRTSPARGGMKRISGCRPTSSAIVRTRSSTETGSAGAHVEHGRGHARMAGPVGHGVQQRADDVIDVDEIARLQAVAIDLDGSVPQQAVAEDRDHPRIGRHRILAGTEHVEEAQAHGRDRVDVAADRGVQLAGDLVRAIGREWSLLGRLAQWQCRASP